MNHLINALREAAPYVAKEYCLPYGDLMDSAADEIERLHRGISRLEADFNDSLIDRNNAEKREYEVHGRANALDSELKAKRDMLLCIGHFAHDRSTGPAVEDALLEVRRMAYEALISNAELRGRKT